MATEGRAAPRGKSAAKGSTPITAETIRSWLHACKAKEPWSDYGISLAVANLEQLRLTARAREAALESRLPVERAQKAIGALRSALRDLDEAAAAEWADMVRLGIHEGGAGTWYQEQLKNVRSMMAALVDLPTKSVEPDLWIVFAETAFECLCYTIEEVTVSRVEGNTAVSFVLSALDAGGFDANMRTRATIERVLNSKRREMATRFA